MNNKIIYSILTVFLMVLFIGCNTQLLDKIDADTITIVDVTLEERGLLIKTSIENNKTNDDYVYGVSISSIKDEETFELDAKTKTIDNNIYEIVFNIRDIPSIYYGSDLLIKPYIKSDDNIIYSNKPISIKIIDEVKKIKLNNMHYDYIDYVTEIIENNFKKVYVENNTIYIDDALYEYNPIILGKEFLKDWNKKFNTNYQSFENFAKNYVGEYNYNGTKDEVINHELYLFFNDDKEMLDKYGWLLDIIKNFNVNYIKNQVDIICGNNENYSAYYGFYHILAQIEAFFTKTQIVSKEYSYSTYDYSKEAAYYAIIRYFKNSEIKKYSLNDYEYLMIGDVYEIDTEVKEIAGKEWKGYSYKSNIYQVGDLFEVTKDNVYLSSSYEYIPYTISFYDQDEELESLKRVYNIESKDITLLNATKYGFNFIGWYTSKTFEEDTKVEVIKKGTTGNITLYAKFEPKDYSIVNVSFDLNGGNWDSDDEIITTIQTPTDLPIPSRNGCKFVGWESNLDSKIYTSYPGYYDFTKKIIYTAIWEVTDMTDKERVDQTYLELLEYFEENKNVVTDLSFNSFNDFYKTNISFNSNNIEVLSNEGIFKRPYTPTTVTVEFTITSNKESKKSTFEFIVDGFKKIDNIASTYVYGGYDRLTDEFFETMDIIFCAFVLIDVEGGFVGFDGYGNSINKTNQTYLNYMKTYVIPKAHQNGVRVVASIGGGGDSVDLAYEAIVKSDEKIETLANNIVKLINEYGFDGADIDWEIPDNAKTFSKLSEKVYKAIKKNNPNHILTAAIGGGKWQPPKYDLTISKNYLDYVNLMTYNMVGNGGYHHTALYKSNKLFDSENKVGHTLQTCSIEESVDIYKKEYGVEANQIIIGAAFYGMKQKRSYSNGVYGSWQSNGTLSYTSIKLEYLNSSNYEYYYDTTCEAPYILSKDKTIFISYDDPRSIKAKCEYIKNIGAAGIMYWQNGQDTTGDLVRAIKEGLNK